MKSFAVGPTQMGHYPDALEKNQMTPAQSRELSVLVQMQRLAEQIGAVHQITDELRRRLDPILRSVPPATEKAGAPITPTGCTLSGELRALSGSVETIHERLAEIVTLLEL